MKGRKLYNKINYLLSANNYTNVKIAALIVLILSAFSSPALLTGRVNQQVVESSSGYIDLSNFNFEEKLAYIPHTSFLFYRNELYMPKDFEHEDFDTEGITINKEGRFNPGNYGTYRIIIKLADTKKYYGLSSDSAMYSQRLFINGIEYPAVGKPGETKETTVPKTTHYKVYFRPDTEEVEIIIQFANFYHYDYGGILPLYFGTQDKILEKDALARQQTNIFVACAFTTFWLFLGLYFFFSMEHAFLWFSLISLSSCLRTLIMNEKSIMLLFPELPWKISIGLEYIALIVLMLSILMYISNMFEGALHKPVIWFFTGVCVLYAAMVLTMPPLIYTRFMLWFVICSALVGLYISVVLIYNVVLNKVNLHREHVLLFVGILIYIILSILNIWVFRTIWRSASLGLANMGMIILISINIIALILRFFRVQENLEEMRQREQEMQHTNLYLDKLMRLKSDFMANISHEILTPLTVMSSYAGLTSVEIQRGAVNKKTLDNLDVIKREAIRLANLVKELKVNSLAKEHLLTPADINALSLLQQAVDICRPICQQNNNTLLITKEYKNITLHVNPDSILQTLLNVLINANRHTKQGIIRLNVQPELDTGYALVSVSDDGEGIDPELLPLLFKRGFSGDGGSGIGLAICKDIIEKHGGKICIESEKGKGTLVRFTLPLSKGE